MYSGQNTISHTFGLKILPWLVIGEGELGGLYWPVQGDRHPVALSNLGSVEEQMPPEMH